MIKDAIVYTTGLPEEVVIGGMIFVGFLSIYFLFFVILPSAIYDWSMRDKSTSSDAGFARITNPPPKSVFETRPIGAENCSEYGDKFCELRGCHIMGECGIRGRK